MNLFKYKARDSKGSAKDGEILAENEKIAREKIAEKGLWIIDIYSDNPEDKKIWDIELDGIMENFSKVSLKDQVIFCRQFSTLINAGVAMMKTMTILSSQSENPKFKKILVNIKDDVEQGKSLSEAFIKFPEIFDKLFVSMVKAGETGGVLDEVMERIAKFMEDRARLTAKVKSAMAYPTVVSVFATIIFFVMLTVILPKFSKIFERLGGELPAYTQFLINLSNFLRSPGLILVIFSIVMLVFGFKKIYATEKGKYHVDAMLLKVPILGDLIQKISIARFTRTLGTLIKSGVPILTALEIVKDSIGNAVVSKTVKEIVENVKQGGTISEPLERSPIFPQMVISMISVGEETGELDAMLSKIADFYDSEVESAVDSLTSLLEPLMMVFLGGMVGAVIVGMYLPMFKIFDAVK